MKENQRDDDEKKRRCIEPGNSIGYWGEITNWYPLLHPAHTSISDLYAQGEYFKETIATAWWRFFYTGQSSNWQEGL